MPTKQVREKTRENKARRAAERRGYWVSKTRRRDRLAPDYGLWTVYRADTGKPVRAAAMTLSQLERWLRKGRAK